MQRQPTSSVQAIRSGAAGDDAGRLSSSLTPIRAANFGYEQARHLLWRAGFGGTPQQIQTLASWGPERAVDYLLNVDAVTEEPTPGELFDKDIMRPPTDEERRAQQAAARAQDEDSLARIRLMRQQREQQDRRQIGEVQKWWLRKLVQTGRPLQEKMALFYHGHFATNYRTIENSYHMFMQNELFRRHAVGNIGELLFQIIRDPAMIAYLDNNDSRKGRANENLARELMELFSLGIGNYGEKDIKEGARALTGYTFVDDAFTFQKNNHDGGPKTILGKSGAMDGDDFVKAILEQPACPRFFARKLYAFFVAELPPAERADDNDLDPAQRSVIRSLAQTLAANKYELKPMLRRMFLSEHFYEPRVMGEQIKSPVQLVVGAIRSLNTPARDLALLNDALDLMGQNLLYPPSVKGWDGGRSWINTSTVFVRQNIMAYLLTGKKPQGYDATADILKYDATTLLDELRKANPGAENDPAAVTDYLLRLTLGGTPSHARETLLGFVQGHSGAIENDHLVAMLLLITAMPEYQLC
jgi:uncharacterized protein (DUF1800 family)